MKNERTSTLIIRLLDECEDAILRHDWQAARSHAESVLALDRNNPYAKKYLEASDRALRPSSAPGSVPPSQASVEAWREALEGYRFPVDFTRFRESRVGFFDFTVNGDHASTLQFQKRFREHAQHDLDAWLEVIFWKMYGQGGRPEREVRKAAAKRENFGPASLWSLCETIRRDFEVDPILAKGSLRQLTAKFFTSQSIATIWTFVSFSDELGRFPMIDRIISDWVYDNYSTLRAADPCGALLRRPKRRSTSRRPVNLNLGDLDDFVVGWVRWTRCLADRLSQVTLTKWTARDVEMAVYSYATGNYRTHLPAI